MNNILQIISSETKQLTKGLQTMNRLTNYLRQAKHLPDCINDFEKQSNLFRSMHHLYQDSESAKYYNMPNTVIGHIYIIDWFLWFMATRGYKLQKIRTNDNIEFMAWPDYQDILKREEEATKENLSK